VYEDTLYTFLTELAIRSISWVASLRGKSLQYLLEDVLSPMVGFFWLLQDEKTTRMNKIIIRGHLRIINDLQNYQQPDFE
jgi:hypothetical protein